MVIEERTLCGNLSAHTFVCSLHVAFSPFLQRAIPNCQDHTQQKTEYKQFKVDEYIIAFYPLDGINRLDIFLPAGKTTPFLGRAGFEEPYNRALRLVEL